MPAGKRVRFEVLRRDGHTCRYCGAKAPDVVLAVDHVIPEALGGTSEPDNLVTACVDCNQGKASIGPDSPIIEDVAKDAIRWQQAIQQAGEMIAADLEAENARIDRFEEAWARWHVGDDETALVPRPDNWRQSVLQFHKSGLPEVQILGLIPTAMQSKVKVPNVWRYYCGCVWNAVRALQDAALSILDAEDFMAEDQARREQFERLAE